MTFSIAESYGYRAGYAALGCVLGAMAILFLITRRRWDEPHDGASQTSGDPGTKSSEIVAVSYRTALRSGRVWLQVLVFFLYTGVESTVGQWCFSWLRERRGLSIEVAGGWTSAYWASLTLGRIVLGTFVDRWGADRTLRCATVGAVIGVSLFAASNGALGSIGLLLLGVSLAPLFPTLMARTPARVGDAVAHHAVGFQVSAATLGSSLVPALVGVLVARRGLGVVGIVVVGIGVALLLAHEGLLGVTRRSPQTS
jgi:fucose permease